MLYAIWIKSILKKKSAMLLPIYYLCVYPLSSVQRVFMMVSEIMHKKKMAEKKERQIFKLKKLEWSYDLFFLQNYSDDLTYDLEQQMRCWNERMFGIFAWIHINYKNSCPLNFLLADQLLSVILYSPLLHSLSYMQFILADLRTPVMNLVCQSKLTSS